MQAFEKIIIITGGAGFIWANFLQKMVPNFPQYAFVNVDSLVAGNLKKIPDSVKNSFNYFFEKIDITDKNAVFSVYKKYWPTDTIHFAAQSSVDFSLRFPEKTLRDNVCGTQNLLEAHRDFSRERFHYISTDEVYGDCPPEGGFHEKSPLFPSSPYSASKASGDILTQSYGRSFGINFTITRSSNTYGPHQNVHSFLPVIMQKIQKNEKIPLYGNGLQKRDWIFVEDHVDAIFRVFLSGKSGEIYNICTQKELTNVAMAEKILQMCGKSTKNIDYISDRPGHDACYTMNAKKIFEDLGWQPKISLEEGLEKTISFYQNYAVS